jgi:hypothetical protein
MQCEQFERILEREEDGGLPQAALAHLEGCEACRALATDFTAIHDLAMELGAEGIVPPERVWISLRNQLAADGIIREPQAAPPRPVAGWWTALQGPALAGAFLSLILAGAVTVSYRWGSPQSAAPPQLAMAEAPSSVPTADSVFKEEVLTVGSDEFSGLPRRDSAVTDSIRRNLQIVDNFIAMCEKSVREQPDNQLAREYLYGAYQQKAELLATAMNRSMSGGVQ